MKLPRILITAMRSGAGKTMLTCGILKAMKMQEINPASFKCGPDYIDPMFHKTVIGISSYNLDSFLCGENGVREILKKNGAGADISVMEGVMGYYDGIAGISSEASAYDIARITDTPAVMILDCKGLSVSAVPCIQGFLHYQEEPFVSDDVWKNERDDRGADRNQSLRLCSGYERLCTGEPLSGTEASKRTKRYGRQTHKTGRTDSEKCRYRRPSGTGRKCTGAARKCTV